MPKKTYDTDLDRRVAAEFAAGKSLGELADDSQVISNMPGVWRFERERRVLEVIRTALKKASKKRK